MSQEHCCPVLGLPQTPATNPTPAPSAVRIGRRPIAGVQKLRARSLGPPPPPYGIEGVGTRRNRLTEENRDGGAHDEVPAVQLPTVIAPSAGNWILGAGPAFLLERTQALPSRGSRHLWRTIWQATGRCPWCPSRCSGYWRFHTSCARRIAAFPRKRRCPSMRLVPCPAHTGGFDAAPKIQYP